MYIVRTYFQNGWPESIVWSGDWIRIQPPKSMWNVDPCRSLSETLIKPTNINMGRWWGENPDIEKWKLKTTSTEFFL